MPPNLKSAEKPHYGSLDQIGPPTDQLIGSDHPIRRLLDEQTKTQRTAWASIHLCAIFNFLASLQFTLYMTSMWPYMQRLDKTVSEGFFGLVIAVYSLSQISASPLLGVWSSYIKRFKPPLIFCNFFLFVGNFLYFLVELFPLQWSRYVLMASRIFAGIGLAQVGLLKSYGITSSVARDRQKATVFIAGGSAMGSICGPLLQMAFTSIDFTGLSVPFSAQSRIRLSMFTAPPLFASLVNLFLLLILIIRFRETYVDVLKGTNPDRVVTIYYQYSKKRLSRLSYDATPLPVYDRLAIFVCYAMRFTQFFVLTSMEAIGTSFAMMMFSWSSMEVVFNESIVNVIFGVIALITYVAYFVFDLGKKLSGRLSCLWALIALLFFYLFTFSWDFLPDVVTVSNGSDFGGCDPNRLNWCGGLKRINLWLYYGLIVCLRGLAFPTLNIKINTLFSRIIGPRLQSKQQCVIEMFGGMGRMAGPILIGFLYLDYGPRTVWLVVAAEIVSMLAIWLLCFPRLVPMELSGAHEPEMANTDDGLVGWRALVRLDSDRLLCEKIQNNS